MNEQVIELRLAAPAELVVPIPRGTRTLPAGTTVRAGDPLLQRPTSTPGTPGQAADEQDLPTSRAVSNDLQPAWLNPRSPLAGVVTGERDVILTSGDIVRGLVLQVSAFQSDSAPRVISRPFTEQLREVLTSSREQTQQLLRQLFNAGLWGHRYGSPDLYEQLRDSEGVDTVLVTALDSDPVLPVCARTIEESAADVVTGGLVAARLSSASRVILVLSTAVSDRVRREVTRLATEAMRVALDARGTPPGSPPGARMTVRVVSYENHYPRGDPSLLVLRLLDRKLPPGALPTTRGALLLDAVMAGAVGRTVRHDSPMLTVPMAIKDHGRNRAYLTRVPIGTPIEHLLTSAGIEGPAAGDTIELRRGDVLQERRVNPDAVLSPMELYLHVLRTNERRPPRPPQASPATNPVGTLLTIARDAATHLATSSGTGSGAAIGGASGRLIDGTDRSPDPCIRCGWCVEACPTHVHPAAALEAAQTANMTMARDANIHACIECGLCQYVCPSRLPLLSALRSLGTGKGGTP